MAEAGLRVRLQQQAPIPLDIAIECAPGELLALVGPSGSGKSTLLRAIAGLFNAEQGRISCHDEDWFRSDRKLCLRPQQRRVGMVFQHYALFPHLSALENVMEALHDQPASARRSKALSWLEQVNLSGLEHRRPARLSGGQQQRVAVARALAREPRVLLLDEPFSAVDRTTREKLYRELVLLRRALNIPVILVTHDVEEALMLADKLCVLSRGRSVQCAPPQEVMRRPGSARVARLVGHKNIFRAQVIEHLADKQVTMIEWRGRRLEARLQPHFVPGASVSWVVPRSKLLIHNLTVRSRGERENPLAGQVTEMVALGDTASVTVSVGESHHPPLHLTLPMHVVERRNIEVGSEIGISVLAAGIHLMPDDPNVRADQVD